MSRWDAVGCDEDAEQIRGSPPFHEKGSGCLPNFSHLGNVPTVPCRSRQVRGELRQSLSGLTCHFPHPPNGVTAIGRNRPIPPLSVCRTAPPYLLSVLPVHDGGWQSTHFAFAVLANAHE